MKSTPFTNSIEVGTEAMAEIWHGLRAVEESLLLSQVLASGAVPVAEKMRARADDGFTSATSLANHLVRQGMPFRAAHHLVGDAVRRAVSAGSTSLTEHGPAGWTDGIDLDVERLAEAHRYGGGPGAFDVSYGQAVADWKTHRDWHLDWRSSLAKADATLAVAVGDLCAGVGEDI
jgi:argininosuccinate lyase